MPSAPHGLADRAADAAGGRNHGQAEANLAPLDSVRLDERWFPKSVRLEYLALGFVTRLDYAYEALTRRPDDGVFSPSVADRPFLPRLVEELGRQGILVEATSPSE